MSQLLQVHMNQRLLKSKSGESSPGSPMLSCPSPGNLSPLSPLSMGPSSPQGMPIPNRRQISEPQHWIVNQNGVLSSSAYASQNGWNGLNTNFDQNTDSMESPFMKMEDMDALSMEGELSKLSMAVDDDDIFKVERSDLLEPTLAELNAPDADAYLDGLTFDDLYWPADTGFLPLEATPSPQTPGGGNSDPINLDPENDFSPFQTVQPSSSFPAVNQKINIPAPGTSVPITLPPNTIIDYNTVQPTLTLTTDNVSSFISSNNPPMPVSSSGGLRELLLRRELQNSLESPDTSPLGQSLPRSISLSPGPGSARLSSSAPSGNHNAWETWQARRESVWQRRDPRPHLLSTGSLAEAGSTSSISADVLSPGRDFSLSMDEGFDSDDVSDHDTSDDDSDNSDTESNPGSSNGTRRERFFWQYNVQAKGPKGQRLVLTPTQEDPHILQRPTDPVFSPLCHIQGIKHSGKARKGDGNDLTPNPRKLWQIGKELDRLNKVIAEMTPVADLPNAVKSRSRKEKNKLASRACRLKKKAQHEANKLKLYGLEQEHKRLIEAIEQSREVIFASMDGIQGASSDPLNPSESLASQVERISKKAGPTGKIGGHTTEFVNKVLDKVRHGQVDGGLFAAE